ncbi:pyruvate kinase [Tundrisphaera sp. TA3]|uniref:pyruvate kinase n=1 Tax=Tundrisphaera sp. TA3 TaxID=3435775 RepID=UPI003EC10316
MTQQHVEAPGQVRTKIVATVGPASRDPETLRALVMAGADVFRLNFSHGTHDEHSAVLRSIRALGEEIGRPLAVLQDLGGPKIRLGTIPGDGIDCELGDRFTLAPERTGDDPRELTSTHRELPGDLRAGDPVLFADGAVAMEVVEGGSASKPARMVVTLAGRIKTRQGINLPGATTSVKALTDKDLADLDWSAKNGVEYIGLSFVRRADDVAILRRELAARGMTARIVSKIEKPEAVADLDAIVAASDAVMVARGDLGVEMDVARVPAIQKRIIAACHRARVPVITATQMLNSMEASNRPTRAEASDVFNAVLDGTDAVMLSGETAAGQYPVEAVSTMSRIVAEAEAFLAGRVAPSPPDAEAGWSNRGWITPITEAIVDAASLAARRLDAPLMIVATHSGRTALAASKHRQRTRILALADDAECARAMALYWGVTPLFAPEIADAAQALETAVAWAREHKIAASGDPVVLVQGAFPGNDTHNALLVSEVG